MSREKLKLLIGFGLLALFYLFMITLSFDVRFLV